MENLTFEDSRPNYPTNNSQGGFIMNFLIKKGIVKSSASANVLMVIVSIIFLAVAVYITYTTLS